MDYISLNNGNKIPAIGFGTYKMTETNQVEKAITAALDCGFRLIDTASVYFNEVQIGNVIKKYNISRDKIFITSKVWNNEQGYENTLKAFEKTISNLQTDYLDMYLIHWAVVDKFLETWKALEYLYEKKLVKNIGVSNFQIHHLNKLLANSNVLPVVNQIELHPYFNQSDLRNFCNKNKIIVESWSPIAKGDVSNDLILNKIAEKYNKTAVQVTLRWHYQNNLLPIPKSVNPDRIKQSIEIFDFSLSDEDIQIINNLNKNMRKGPDPDNFNF